MHLPSQAIESANHRWTTKRRVRNRFEELHPLADGFGPIRTLPADGGGRQVAVPLPNRLAGAVDQSPVVANCRACNVEAFPFGGFLLSYWLSSLAFPGRSG